LIKPPGIIYSPFGGSVILEKLGSTFDHSNFDKFHDREKFKIVKTNFKFEVLSESTNSLRKSSLFGQPSLVNPILIVLVSKGCPHMYLVQCKRICL
jgi:hypothetical protein